MLLMRQATSNDNQIVPRPRQISHIISHEVMGNIIENDEMSQQTVTWLRNTLQKRPERNVKLSPTSDNDVGHPLFVFERWNERVSSDDERGHSSRPENRMKMSSNLLCNYPTDEIVAFKIHQKWQWPFHLFGDRQVSCPFVMSGLRNVRRERISLATKEIVSSRPSSTYSAFMGTNKIQHALQRTTATFVFRDTTTDKVAPGKTPINLSSM